MSSVILAQRYVQYSLEGVRVLIWHSSSVSQSGRYVCTPTLRPATMMQMMMKLLKSSDSQSWCAFCANRAYFWPSGVLICAGSRHLFLIFSSIAASMSSASSSSTEFAFTTVFVTTSFAPALPRTPIMVGAQGAAPPRGRGRRWMGRGGRNDGVAGLPVLCRSPLSWQADGLAAW